jgi:hypothetical protein
MATQTAVSATGGRLIAKLGVVSSIVVMAEEMVLL